MKLSPAWIIGMLGAASAQAQPTSVVNSPHNLSASGPGAIRASTEDEVCIFCHAPHNSTPVRPLWNRATPVDGYAIYTSRALNAQPGQPTGNSKMCLSCHDGTIALGNVSSRGAPILMSGGVTTLPPGRASRIGTDLRDDHPVSFRYDSTLVGHNSKLRSPGALPPEVKLDSNMELQCTSCHDAHNNALGKFMVMRNDNSEMCASCHQMGQTTVTAHNNCSACHQPHSAPSGPYLLKRATITETCNSCHNGLTVGAADIASELRKPHVHDTGSPVDPTPPLSDHVSCADCHEPHTMQTGGRLIPNTPANFGAIGGVSTSGSLVSPATSEFEVCFKCHADDSRIRPIVSRVAQTSNTRLEFNQSAVSFHPVTAQGRNMTVPSLRPGWTTSSRVACTSCHGSESGTAAGGTGPNGVHGSTFEGNLLTRYEVADYTGESAQAYALCYRCHDRSSILANQSFPLHSRHIVEERAPCAACHDAHGIGSTQGNATNNSNLINFATTMVTPDPATHRLEFRDTGNYSGQCFLSCHGANHSGLSYPEGGGARGPGARRLFGR